MGVAWPPTQLDHLCNQTQSDAIRRPSEAIRGHQRPSEANQRPSEATQRPLRRDHLRALEIAISLESVDQTCPPDDPIARMEHDAFTAWCESAPMARRLERRAPWR